jgi:hypothetical protein
MPIISIGLSRYLGQKVAGGQKDLDAYCQDATIINNAIPFLTTPFTVTAAVLTVTDLQRWRRRKPLRVHTAIRLLVYGLADRRVPGQRARLSRSDSLARSPNSGSRRVPLPGTSRTGHGSRSSEGLTLTRRFQWYNFDTW